MALPLHFVSQGEDADTPEWQPLIDLVGEDLVGSFMWMYRVRGTHGDLQAYKHIDTRRYLHLDEDGDAYAYLGDKLYRPSPVAAVLEEALSPLWEDLDVDPREVSLARAAVRRVRARRGTQLADEYDPAPP